MKIGLGFYREQLTPDNFRFAVQAGATHVVAHLTNYFAGRDPKIHGGGARQGWGACSADTKWTYEEMTALVASVRAEGLETAAQENFSPRIWYDVLLDSSERAAQIEGLKRLIRDAGRAGVPCIGYNDLRRCAARCQAMRKPSLMMAISTWPRSSASCATRITRAS